MKWLLILLLVLPVCSGAKKAEKKKEAPKKEEEVLLPLPPGQILSPLESIKALDHKIESYKTGSNLAPKDLQDNRKLKQEIIRGTFDIKELCKLAMDIHWNSMSEKERKGFVDLMTNLLERKAIFSKEQVRGEGKPYRIDYLGQKFLDPEKRRARVTTKVTVPSQKIDLNINYEMQLTPYAWQIYDVIVDDASLVENYKFQFDTIIKKHGRAELEKRMKKKLAEME